MKKESFNIMTNICLLYTSTIALEKIQSNEFLDLISIYITSGMRALGEITGDELEEDLLNKIFSEFCVGK